MLILLYIPKNKTGQDYQQLQHFNASFFPTLQRITPSGYIKLTNSRICLQLLTKPNNLFLYQNYFG